MGGFMNANHLNKNKNLWGSLTLFLTRLSCSLMVLVATFMLQNFATLPAQAKVATIQVSGMTCGMCAENLTKKISALTIENKYSFTNVNVSFTDQKITAEFNPKVVAGNAQPSKASKHTVDETIFKTAQAELAKLIQSQGQTVTSFSWTENKNLLKK